MTQKEKVNDDFIRQYLVLNACLSISLDIIDDIELIEKSKHNLKHNTKNFYDSVVKFQKMFLDKQDIEKHENLQAGEVWEEFADIRDMVRNWIELSLKMDEKGAQLFDNYIKQGYKMYVNEKR
jgi:hypothetical protein